MKLNRLLLALIASSSLAVGAQTLTFPFGTVLGQNVQSPTGPAPWVTAVFTSIDSTSVRLDVVLSMLDSEYMSKIAFNINGTFDSSDLVISNLTTIGSFSPPETVIDFNSIKGPEGSEFDFGFNFSTSNANGGGKLFNGNDSISFMINYNGLESFNVLSFDEVDSSGKFKGIAHFQSIGTENTSAWVVPASVPEPAAALLGAFGFLVLLRRRRA